MEPTKFWIGFVAITLIVTIDCAIEYDVTPGFYFWQVIAALVPSLYFSKWVEKLPPILYDRWYMQWLALIFCAVVLCVNTYRFIP